MEPAPHLNAAASSAGSWIPRAVDCLKSGAIVALPTETFYGLAIDPRNQEAVDRLLRLKGHRRGRPLLLLAGSVEQVESLAFLDPRTDAALLARTFWPGPLTLILPLRAAARLPACPGGTMAIRVSSNPVACEAARAFGVPITGTSANRAGDAPARTADQVAERFAAGLGLVLDGGTTDGGLPSTLVDLSSGGASLLRVGAVGAAEVEATLGRPIRVTAGRA